MTERLVISGTIPRWVSRLAKEYHTFQGDRHIKALRVWYRLSDRSKTPDWVLTRFVNQAGVPYSAVWAQRRAWSSAQYRRSLMTSM